MRRILVTWWMFAVAASILSARPPNWSREEIKRIQRSASYGFKPAEYRGLRMGVSRKEDVLRVFGRPVAEGKGEDGFHYLTYRDIGIVKGPVDVVVEPKSDIVHFIAVYPENTTVQAIIQELGPGAVETRWSWATCEEDMFVGFGPAYLDTAGDHVGTEYRHLGIYIVPLEDGKVRSIRYSSSPAGLDADPCPKARPQRRKE